MRREPALEQVRGGARVLRASRLRRTRPERCARRVVKRSSYSSTGTPPPPSSSREALREVPRLARLLGVLAAQRQRQADEHELGLALGDELASRAKPRLVAGRSTVSIGVTIVPVGSLIAQPQRALP